MTVKDCLLTAKRISEQMLFGRWVHSHEEDSETEMVYRPSTFDFPPARGRQSFELNTDFSYIEIGIGPTDRPQEFYSRWELDNKGVLKIYDTKHSKLIKVMSVISVEANRLLIEKSRI